MAAAPEDPAVGPVEEMLTVAAGRSGAPMLMSDGRVVATYAAWLCACESMQDAPLWVVHSAGADGIGWLRSDTAVDVSDLVAAEHVGGGHPSPEGVLLWLKGEWTDPWMGRGDGAGDTAVFAELARRIRHLTDETGA